MGFPITDATEAVAAVIIAYASIAARLDIRKTQKTQDRLLVQQQAASDEANVASAAAAVRAQAVADALVQSDLAAKVAASAAAVHAQEVADALIKSDRAAMAEAKEASGKLDVIHEWVNSDLTMARKAELDSTRRELVLLRSIKPTDQHAIEIAEARIAELETMLVDRGQRAAAVPLIEAATEAAVKRV